MKKLFIILALLAATVAASGMINKPKPEPVYITATAGAYSTTWELACKLAQEYGDERDVRDHLRRPAAQPRHEPECNPARAKN